MHCGTTTSGAGADNLVVAYGVFVRYTDDTYRSWGNRLYVGNVDRGFQVGALVNHPLFLYRDDPPALPTEIDVKSPGRTVRYIRVTITLCEEDYAGSPVPSIDRRGAPFVTDLLRHNRWRGYLGELDSDQRETILSTYVLRDSTLHLYNKIGVNEHKFTADELENPERFTQVDSASQLASLASTRPGRGVSYHFTNTGDGSLYTGKL